MCVNKPSYVYHDDIDEVTKAEMWLGYLLGEYNDCHDGKVPVNNPQHLFGSLKEIHKLLLEYIQK